VILAEPAADARTAADAEYQAHAPCQVDPRMVRWRLHIQEDRQGERNERAAREALDDAGKHELHRRVRQRVEHQPRTKKAIEN